jgi:hypothetical protein
VRVAQQLVRVGYQIMTENPMMDDACDKWCERTAAERTWQLFKTFFKAQHRALKK